MSHKLRQSRVIAKMVAVSAVLVVSLAVAACGSSNTWSTVKTGFLKGCEEAGSNSVCECTFNKIRSSVSLSEFISASKAKANGGPEPKWAISAAEACVASN